jgi:hypothetical protein
MLRARRGRGTVFGGAFEPDGTKKVPGEVAAKTAARGSGAWRGGCGSRSQGGGAMRGPGWVVGRVQGAGSTA